MPRCVIFCAGGFRQLLEEVKEEDYIIAADGGLAHAKKMRLQPDKIIGDFDSLGYVPDNAALFPIEKDDTDTMLSVRHGLSLGYDSFLLYGSLDGPRPDHTIANFQTLQYLADRDAHGYLVGLTHMATVIKNGSLSFPARAEGIVSVFCMGSDAKGVTLSGLKYTLHDGCLSAGFPLGVSNRFIGCEATVSVKDGSLLVLWEKAAGLPTRR